MGILSFIGLKTVTETRQESINEYWRGRSNILQRVTGEQVYRAIMTASATQFAPFEMNHADVVNHYTRIAQILQSNLREE